MSQLLLKNEWNKRPIKLWEQPRTWKHICIEQTLVTNPISKKTELIKERKQREKLIRLWTQIMNSIILSFTILIFAFVLFERSECRVLPVHRVVGGQGMIFLNCYRVNWTYLFFKVGPRRVANAPGMRAPLRRGRWFRTYGRMGGYGGPGPGPGAMGGPDAYGGPGDGGYDGGDIDDGGYGGGGYGGGGYGGGGYGGQKNVKVKVKVYTAEGDRDWEEDPE